MVVRDDERAVKDKADAASATGPAGRISLNVSQYSRGAIENRFTQYEEDQLDLSRRWE
jgi:hypothetical protein